MKGFINFLLGCVRVNIEGLFPERVLNLCAQNAVEFWAIDWKSEVCIAITLRRKGVIELKRLAEKAGCKVEVTRSWGMVESAQKFRGRYGFLIGLFVILCAVTLLSQFVLTIELSGNKEVEDAVILQQLRRFGVRQGVFGPILDRRQIEQEILLELPELSWMSINLYGTRAEVLVREVRQEPERVKEDGHYHVISDVGGIVEHIEPEQGDAAVKRGDTVSKGDVLISGTVTLEPPLYSDQPERYYYVHARGEVWARTWREVSAAIPLETVRKTYTGKAKNLWSLIFFGKRVEFFGKSSIPVGSYDKITSVRQIGLPTVGILPLWLNRDTYREYESALQNVDQDASTDLLRSQLLKHIETLVGTEGQVLQVDFKTRIRDGLLEVSASAECREEIGVEVPAHRLL